MRQTILLRNLSIYYTRNFIQSPPIFKLNKIPPIQYFNFTQPISQSLFSFRFFTSKNDHSSSIKISDNFLQDDESLEEMEDEDLPQVEDVTNEEFKQRIERYDRGDDGALLDIFEAIVRRKLAGKHGAESDDEILKEFRNENPLNIVSDDEVDSDFGDTDSEN